MPITPTYPGVYVEEISSGVHTITGVSTSVTAFLGAAKRGPINKAVHILSYSDFERNFGGLDIDSELSYSVRQFFLNGGSDAWVVRLAKNAQAAALTLKDGGDREVLTITAIDEGRSGNSIEVRVDYQTLNPASTFNLTLSYTSPDNPSDRITEKFENLSLNSRDVRYVETAINGTSRLVTVKRKENITASLNRTKGTSISGELPNVNNLIDDKHNQFQISVNGLEPITIAIASTDISGNTPQARLAGVIQRKVRDAANGTVALSTFTCTFNANNQLVLEAGDPGEFSSVKILPGVRSDLSARLKLGPLNGGTETDAIASIRPQIIPPAATFTSEALTLTNLNPENTNRLSISIDGHPWAEISIGTDNLAGDNLADKLSSLAQRLQAAVQALKPSIAGYRNFTSGVNNNALILSSGTQGSESSIAIESAKTKDVAASLNLLTPPVYGSNILLAGGTEEPYSEPDAYSLLFSNQAERKGIYALEGVDLFNLLCIPGITDGGVLAEAAAYCQERRAFLIADAPKTKTVSETADHARSPELPKTSYGAVYYPWVYTPDPLNNGKLRLTAPSGVVAGLYARTDSARGVWKAPAGTEANLVGVQALNYKLTDAENGILNPLGVNCIRLLPGYGVVAWGARTLKGSDQAGDEYKYIPVRRLALFIEESLYRGTQWVVFEPNDEPLWAQIRLNLGAFMHNLFRQGAFQGKSPREAYFVKCDSETTTQNDINLGIVNIKVGFAPLKPAEFVMIQLQQMAGQIQV
jgi:phage tail sheath protein FI